MSKVKMSDQVCTTDSKGLMMIEYEWQLVYVQEAFWGKTGI